METRIERQLVVSKRKEFKFLSSLTGRDAPNLLPEAQLQHTNSSVVHCPFWKKELNQQATYEFEGINGLTSYDRRRSANAEVGVEMI
ncbi:hypothetical protein M514_08515 [Trichuris suis]|uniref:Uncharacterized protein n=1 Tax=Trichuris suis TaxID=68888 RepID=A0A085M020_9BILA|nr:hypothetical protein M513_08515 [Trichuris suis]KFD67658.1 hypothetical protein M514_08515 [Trichuris suis]